MISKDIEQITKDDLQALIDNEVIERKTIEYKQALPSNSDSDKKEFLADVSSFANASGGDVIFGVVQDHDTGVPEDLQGLNNENIDQEIARLENTVRDGIEPRIPSIITRPVPLDNTKVALVMRVQKSWISPHRVTYKGHDKFYSRSSNGKYPLDVGELRIVFNLSETMTERIRNFRLDRVSKIYANVTPVPFFAGAKIVLHLIPLISFNPAQAYDMGIVESGKVKMVPIYCSGWNSKYNFDGFLTYSWGNERKSHSYVQLFRNGIIEAVEGGLLAPHADSLTIPSVRYEQELINSLTEYLSILKTLNVEPPIFAFLSLIGVAGYSMAIKDIYIGAHDSYMIDREFLPLPEIVLESYDVNAEKVLKPCFDSVWNACGFPRDLYYNENGEWAPR